MTGFRTRGMYRCESCGKWTYRSRRSARQAARDFHPGEHMSAYECPDGKGWHIGHLAGRVVRGKDDRGHHYGRAS